MPFQLPPVPGTGPDTTDDIQLPDLTPVGTGDERPTSAIENQDWRTDLRTELAKHMRSFAKDLGQPEFVFNNWIKEHFDEGLSYLFAQGWIATDSDFLTSDDVLIPGGGALTIGDLGDQQFDELSRTPFIKGKANPYSTEGLTRIFEMSLMWIDSQIPGFGQWRTSSAAPAGTGSRGPSGPSAQDIRNSMDEDQLTNGVTDLWRAYLLDEPEDARRVARDYIDKIVSTKGAVEIDFKTFVLEKMKKTGRYQSLYANKEPGKDELQHLQPYVASAQAALGGQGTMDVAAQGAKLGASSQGFSARLQREDAVRNSQGFIGGLEQRVRGVKDVLRG